MDESLKVQLQPMLQKASRSIAAARKHIEEGDYDFASSRAYYAVFYALEAILLTKGLTFSKHSAVIAAFNQHFVKTGVFPKEFSRFISRLFREREAGDYEFDLSIQAGEAEEDIQIAGQVLEAIVAYLAKEGLIERQAR